MSTENEGGLFSCPVMCWIIGALLGLATYLILAGRFAMGTTLSVILAVAVFAAAAFLLGRLFCRPSVSTHAHPARHDHDIATTSQAVAGVDRIGGGDLATTPVVPDAVRETTSAGSAAAATASVATVSKADSAIAGAKPATKAKSAGPATSKAKSASAAGTGAKKAAAKPATKAKAAAKPAAKAKAAAKPAAKAKAAAKPATATKAASKPAAAASKPAAKKPAAKTATKPARKPVAKDGKPEMLKKARAGGADNLKEIKGVGPKMETMLNKMGIYHFDQVSGWRVKEVKWVDENLEGFKGRVSRDEWVKQAKILARGGETEFSKKVEKGGVYAKNKK